MTQANTKIGAYNLLILSCILWGFAPIFFRHGLAHVGIFVFLFLRYAVGAVSLFIADRAKYRRIKPKVVLSIASLAILDCVLANTFYSYGIQRTSLLHAAIISLSVPFFVYFFAGLFLRERIHGRVVVGGVVSAIGLLLIILPNALGSGQSSVIGDMAILAEGLCTGIGVVWARGLLRRSSLAGSQFSFIEYVTASIVFLPLVIFSGGIESIFNLGGVGWLWIVAAGIFAGALPVKMYFSSVKGLSAERLADGSFIVPMVTAVVGIVYYQEALTWLFVGGSLLVVAGLLYGHDKLRPHMLVHRLHLGGSQRSRLRSA